MEKKITLYRYLATNVPSDSHFILNKFGSYQKAKNIDELENQLKSFVNTYGSNGLKALSEIHPDRELIENDCQTCIGKEEVIKSLKKDKEKEKEQFFYNATGSGDDDKIVSKISNNMFIVGGFVVLAVALLIKQNK